MKASPNRQIIVYEDLCAFKCVLYTQAIIFHCLCVNTHQAPDFVEYSRKESELFVSYYLCHNITDELWDPIYLEFLGQWYQAYL